MTIFSEVFNLEKLKVLFFANQAYFNSYRRQLYINIIQQNKQLS